MYFQVLITQNPIRYEVWSFLPWMVWYAAVTVVYGAGMRCWLHGL